MVKPLEVLEIISVEVEDALERLRGFSEPSGPDVV